MFYEIWPHLKHNRIWHQQFKALSLKHVFALAFYQVCFYETTRKTICHFEIPHSKCKYEKHSSLTTYIYLYYRPVLAWFCWFISRCTRCVSSAILNESACDKCQWFIHSRPSMIYVPRMLWFTSFVVKKHIYFVASSSYFFRLKW